MRLIRYSALGLWAATIALSGAVLAQIPRKDVLECAFADGSKVILESKYVWHPIQLNPHGGDRSDQERFKMYYKPHGSFRKVELETSWGASRLSYRSDGSDDDSLISDCDAFKKIKGVMSAPQDLYVDSNKLHYKFDGILPEREALEKKASVTLNAYLWGSPVRVLKNKLIYQEHSLVAEKTQIVVAVIQSESRDLGKTWNVLGITTKARIYKLGKTEAQQSFVARPTRVNGKRFKPISQANKPLSCEPDNLSIECGRMLFECDGPNPSQECARFPKQ